VRLLIAANRTVKLTAVGRTELGINRGQGCSPSGESSRADRNPAPGRACCLGGRSEGASRTRRLIKAAPHFFGDSAFMRFGLGPPAITQWHCHLCRVECGHRVAATAPLSAQFGQWSRVSPYSSLRQVMNNAGFSVLGALGPDVEPEAVVKSLIPRCSPTVFTGSLPTLRDRCARLVGTARTATRAWTPTSRRDEGWFATLLCAIPVHWGCCACEDCLADGIIDEPRMRNALFQAVSRR
jgi:hypothetical protein